MGYSDEATQLRRRQAAFVDRLASYPGQVVDGSPSLVIRITSATTGTPGPKFWAAAVSTPSGSSALGSMALFDPDTNIFLAACINGGSPAVGDKFVATLVEGYWCFEG